MKAFTVIAKVLAALATVAGIVYIAATYGDKIVAWAKKMLGSCPCCGKCTCTEEDVAEEAPAEEEVPAEEETPAAEEAPAEEAPVADESDFEG